MATTRWLLKTYEGKDREALHNLDTFDLVRKHAVDIAGETRYYIMGERGTEKITLYESTDKEARDSLWDGLVIMIGGGEWVFDG